MTENNEECTSKYEDTPLTWTPDTSCKFKGKPVSTRLETHPEEEYDGFLFDRDCPCLDKELDKKKDKFIDECPINLPEVPQAVLKEKKFPSIDSPGIPTSEIPKALLSRLITCSIKGRTAGFDLDVERDLHSDGHPVIIDPDEALIPLAIQFGDRGTLKLGIDVKAESCFCDETCGNDDFIKLKFSAGAKYIPAEVPEEEEGDEEEPDHSLITDPSPLVTIDEENLTQLFYTTKPPGSLAQIVSYEPEFPSNMSLKKFHKINNTKYYYCNTENWHASGPSVMKDQGGGVHNNNEEVPKMGNRWKYKIRLLAYNAENAPEVVVDNANDLATDMVFSAYNLNEYHASTNMLPSGVASQYPWFATYYSIMSGVQFKGKSATALPCPIGSVVYVIDTTPLERCKSEDVEDCDDCIPPLLFYKQNKEVPLKKPASLANFVRFDSKTGWVVVKSVEAASGAFTAKSFENVEIDPEDPHAMNADGEFKVKLPKALLKKYKVL